MIITELSGYFEYANVNSFSNYGLRLVNIETDRNLSMIGEIDWENSFYKKSIRNLRAVDRYDDSPLQFEVEFYHEGGEIPSGSITAIERWLFHRSKYYKLYVLDGDCSAQELSYQTDENNNPMYLNCRFVNPEKIECYGGIVGYRATLCADSPMAWVNETTQSFTLTGGSASANQTIQVVVNSDLEEYIWPYVTITTGTTGGNVTIANLSDSLTRLTGFNGLTAETQVVMNGETNYISGQNYTKFQNKNFIRLKNGTNNISVTGDVVAMSFKFKNRRFL